MSKSKRPNENSTTVCLVSRGPSRAQVFRFSSSSSHISIVNYFNIILTRLIAPRTDLDRTVGKNGSGRAYRPCPAAVADITGRPPDVLDRNVRPLELILFSNLHQMLAAKRRLYQFSRCLYSLYMGLLRKAWISRSISAAHSWKRRRRSCGGHLEFIGSGHLGADYKMSRMCILPANYVNAPPYRKPRGSLLGWWQRLQALHDNWAGTCSLRALRLHMRRRSTIILLINWRILPKKWQNFMCLTPTIQKITQNRCDRIGSCSRPQPQLYYVNL